MGGPYGRRIQRKLRLSGQVLGASGVLHAAQLYGPPSACEWQVCWAIFQTGAIMLEVLSAATLDLWEKTVTNYAGRYDAEAWALIYQTEVRARLEHMSHVRRDAAAAKVQATAAGGTHLSMLARLGSGSFVRRRMTPSSGAQSLRNLRYSLRPTCPECLLPSKVTDC